MNRRSFSVTARATFGGLFLILAVGLGLLALNVHLLEGREGGESTPDVPQASSSAQVPAGAAVTCPSIGFSHNTLVDFSAVSGEPFINNSPNVGPHADQPYISVPFGFSTTVSLLWKSIDGGRTFIQLGTPIVRDAAPAPGGGDTHQDFDALGRFYYCDLSAACVTTAVSDDGGNTFPKINPLTCVGPTDPGGITDDRQWSGGFGDGRGYMTTRNLAVSGPGGNFHLARTRDAGVTWNSFNQPIGTVSQSGPLVMDKTKRNIGGTNYIVGYQIYHTGGTALRMLRIRDNDSGGPTVAVDDLPIVTPGGSVATVFPVMAIDKNGGLYAVWSESTQIRMVTSQNFGQTWSAVKVVSGPVPPAAKIMPWIIAGDPGRANVVWYQSTLGTGSSLDNRWDIYMAQTLNAFSATPTFETTKVSEHTIHFGEICLRGLNCDLPISPGDRSFLEFPSIALDARGAAVITWNDNTNQSGLLPASGPVAGGPYVMFAKQVRGPSLYASVGNLDQGPGTVTIAQPTNGQTVIPPTFNISGTHTLPPGTFDKDELGDGKFPDHGPVIGSNIPALDIRKVTMSDDANDIIVTMEVADLTTPALAAAPALSGGDGLLYLTQWDYDKSVANPIDNVQFVAVEIRGGVPVGRTGTLGVIRSSTSKKYITYNPDLVNSTQVDVAITNTAPGTITLRIPRNLVESPANGDRFHTVTSYAMSERGALVTPACPPPPATCENIFNPTSLPLKVDASGAFSYVVGEGPQYDGIVEYSLDDPNFTNSEEANLNSANNTWTAQLGPSDLTPGTHVLYVRQIINCNIASPVASVVFVVPGGPAAVSALSRKTHGGANFNVNLPLTGPSGVECRNKGDDAHKVLITFANPVTVNGGSPPQAFLAGVGSVTNVTVNGSVVTVDLAGVGNAQTVTIVLRNVFNGTNTGNVGVPMGILQGDVNASRIVTTADTNLTKGNALKPVTVANFRTDVNATGNITTADTNLVKGKALTKLD